MAAMVWRGPSRVSCLCENGGGDVVEAEIVESKKDYAIANVTQVLELHPIGRSPTVRITKPRVVVTGSTSSMRNR